MRSLNLGILAHVDAGKTTLTERLLYNAGAIDAPGSVDDGNTQTDTLALERQRGITIKSAVVSFRIAELTVNLIDTPGHPDFIAEVERVLTVLDGAVLVVSAVEGVQAQTRILMRALQRLHVPTLIFINKIDRAGADVERVLNGIASKLTPSAVAMGAPHQLGSRDAGFAPRGADDPAFVRALLAALAQHDDALLPAFVGDAPLPPYNALRSALVEQTRLASTHPVFCGSAITGAGVEALTDGIAGLLPRASGEPDGRLSGAVFKVQRGPAGEKSAYVRMFSGTIRMRDQVQVGAGRPAKVTAISVFEDGLAVVRSSVVAGQIARLSGLADVRVGDRIGETANDASEHYFAPPTLETVVMPRTPSERGALYSALTQLAEQDPLINVRHDEVRREIAVSLYGEVQKEVIQATLASDFGVDVDFRESTTICVEGPAGVGHAVEFMKQRGNPFLATVGLRIEPAPIDAGIDFRRAIEVHGTMPPAFFQAIEDTVRETLHQGLHGWEVRDCIVTLTHTGYAPRQSHAHQGFSKAMSSTGTDFRGLTPLVLMRALAEAGSLVYEPVNRFQLDVPEDTLPAVWPALARVHAECHSQQIEGAGCTLEGDIPAARVHELQQQLPGLTRGEGALHSAFDRYQPVTSAVPSRPRTDHNPLDRDEYLLHVMRRVSHTPARANS